MKLNNTLDHPIHVCFTFLLVWQSSGQPMLNCTCSVHWSCVPCPSHCSQKELLPTNGERWMSTCLGVIVCFSSQTWRNVFLRKREKKWDKLYSSIYFQQLSWKSKWLLWPVFWKIDSITGLQMIWTLGTSCLLGASLYAWHKIKISFINPAWATWYSLTQSYFLPASSPEQPTHHSHRTYGVPLQMLIMVTMSSWLVIWVLMINFLDDISTVWKDVSNRQGLNISVNYIWPQVKKPRRWVTPPPPFIKTDSDLFYWTDAFVSMKGIDNFFLKKHPL